MVHPKDKRPNDTAAKQFIRFSVTEEAERVAARLAIQITLKNWERCHAIIDRMEHGEYEEADIPADPLDTPLIELLGDVRICNSLERIGVLTIRQALERTKEELLTAPDFGEKALERVQQAAREVIECLPSDVSSTEEARHNAPR